MESKPYQLLNDDFINNLYLRIKADKLTRKTLSMIQFTDLHLDLEYTVGASKTCNNVLCCRKDDGFPDDPKDGAGPFGSLALCDTPEAVLFRMADKINDLAPDVLFWTGDVVPHD